MPHFRQPHRPSEHELRMTNIYAQQAAELFECKQGEEALSASEARFRSYFELGLIGMAMTSPDKGFLEVNEELCQILGYSRNELLKKNWAELTHPDDLAADVTQFNRVMAGEIDGYKLDKRWIRKDGQVINSIMAARSLRRRDGSADYFVGLVLDTTERKRAESALEKLQAELAHVTRVTTMGELAASIAHEVNQPLGAIVNNGNVALRLIRSLPGHPVKLREILSDIVQDANRTSAVIARIRALAKPSALEKSSLQLKDVVTDVLALAGRELGMRRVTVRTELAPHLPHVFGDRVQLQQVLLNLVMNGCDAMSAVPDGRRVLTIACSRDKLDGRPAILLSVSDLGRGFKPGDADRLFEAFYTTKRHGMGMGLRISRSIVEAHGGRLWATSNANPGATFYCALPVAN